MVRRKRIFPFFLSMGILGWQILATGQSLQESRTLPARLNEAQLAPIAEVVEQAIRAGQIPGAVVLIGNQGKVVYRRAFGCRAIEPKKLLMTENTIFDLSSLTKVIATTPAVLQLVEKGKLRIDNPVVKYWMEFGANGKEQITIGELLTHYSGLRPGFDPQPKWAGPETALKMMVAEKPVSPPGTRFMYSDINFIVLGELVSRVSGQPFDEYCAEHLFKPLGMKDTIFRPSPALYPRIALTQPHQDPSGKWSWGEVHDFFAYSMGGVAGHAGLFSTADDLAVFAQTLLNGGGLNGVRVLSPLMVEKMSTPQNPPNKMVLRGFGWDIDSPFSANRGELFPLGSYGHKGFTGTSIWIDPVSQTYIIILTNRVHPRGKGDAEPLRSQIANVVAAALGPVSAGDILASRRSLTGYYELMKRYRLQGFRNGQVQTGIDVLSAQQFSPLIGLRVGLITNLSGLDSAGRRTIDLLAKAPGVDLVSIFTPEFGLSGVAGEKMLSSIDPITGLPVYRLYGDGLSAAEKMLQGLDALVFDLQEPGTRFGADLSILGYTMEAAARKGIAFYVLDRPNPISASQVQGPVMDKDQTSFTGHYPLPIRHGMTAGELAQMFNAEKKIGVKLHITRMRGYQRTDWYDETGLQWVSPSPYLGTLAGAALYPGVAMIEGGNISVGKGTSAPFEQIGAPWIKAKEFASYLNNRDIQGVRFIPVDFLPQYDRFENILCHGVQILLIDRQALDSPELGIELIGALQKLYPQDFQLDLTQDRLANQEVLQAIQEGRDPSSIVHNWQGPLAEFLKIRVKYLLY